MRKNRVRLNEGQLRNIVKESVRNTLAEMSNKQRYPHEDYIISSFSTIIRGLQQYLHNCQYHGDLEQMIGEDPEYMQIINDFVNAYKNLVDALPEDFANEDY